MGTFTIGFSEQKTVAAVIDEIISKISTIPSDADYVQIHIPVDICQYHRERICREYDVYAAATGLTAELVILEHQYTRFTDHTHYFAVVPIRYIYRRELVIHGVCYGPFPTDSECMDAKDRFLAENRDWCFIKYLRYPHTKFVVTSDDELARMYGLHALVTCDVVSPDSLPERTSNDAPHDVVRDAIIRATTDSVNAGVISAFIKYNSSTHTTTYRITSIYGKDDYNVASLYNIIGLHKIGINYRSVAKYLKNLAHTRYEQLKKTHEYARDNSDLFRIFLFEVFAIAKDIPGRTDLKYDYAKLIISPLYEPRKPERKVTYRGGGKTLNLILRDFHERDYTREEKYNHEQTIYNFHITGTDGDFKVTAL